MSSNPQFIHADWNAPQNVKTLISTRSGGCSTGECAGFNLAFHVNDNPQNVTKNREILNHYVPANPNWLNQTHSNNILDLDKTDVNALTAAQQNPYDAAITRQAHKVCVVMTADCLPILLTDTHSSFVAAVHAGWKGVENGIIGKSIRLSHSEPQNILAYIGPAICQQHFEVGTDVFDIFMHQSGLNRQFFTRKADGKYYCDLAGIAKLQLVQAGLKPHNIYCSRECTYCNTDLFYSYRRDNKTGRFASLIWIE